MTYASLRAESLAWRPESLPSSRGIEVKRLTDGLESTCMVSSTVAGDSSTWIDDGQYDMHIRRWKDSYYPGNGVRSHGTTYHWL